MYFFSPKHLLYIKNQLSENIFSFQKKPFDSHVTEDLQRDMVKQTWVDNKKMMALNNWGWVKGRRSTSFWRRSILWVVGHILHPKTTYVVLRGKQVCLTPSPLLLWHLLHLNIYRMLKIMDKPIMDSLSSCVGRIILFLEHKLCVVFCFLP